MNDNNGRTNMKQLVAVIERGDGDVTKKFWTRIGVAFENRDGSWNLRFDYFPTGAGTTIQLRGIDAHDQPRDEPRPRVRKRRAANAG